MIGLHCKDSLNSNDYISHEDRLTFLHTQVKKITQYVPNLNMIEYRKHRIECFPLGVDEWRITFCLGLGRILREPSISYTINTPFQWRCH